VAERLEQLEAAHVGQLHVDDGHVEAALRDALEDDAATGRRADDVAQLAEDVGHGLVRPGIVVDDENPAALAHVAVAAAGFRPGQRPPRQCPMLRQTHVRPVDHPRRPSSSTVVASWASSA